MMFTDVLLEKYTLHGRIQTVFHRLQEDGQNFAGILCSLFY